MDYGKIISKAWKSMWNNKILWIFGLFGSQLTIRSLITTFITPNQQALEDFSNPLEMYLQSFIGEYGLDLAGYSLWIFVAALMVMGLIRYYFMIMGVIGINRGVVWERKNQPIEFAALFKDSQRFFWRYFTAGLAIVVIVFGIMMIFVLGTGFLGTADMGIIASFCLFCGLFLVIIPFSILFGQGLIIMVIQDLDIYPAMKEAWNFILRKHLGQYAVMTLNSIGISIGIAIIISIPTFFISFATMSTALTSGTTMQPQPLGEVAMFFIFLSQLFSGALYSVTIVFSSAIWVHLYLDLKEDDRENDLPLPEEGEVIGMIGTSESDEFVNPTDELPSVE